MGWSRNSVGLSGSMRNSNKSEPVASKNGWNTKRIQQGGEVQGLRRKNQYVLTNVNGAVHSIVHNEKLSPKTVSCIKTNSENGLVYGKVGKAKVKQLKIGGRIIDGFWVVV